MRFFQDLVPTVVGSFMESIHDSDQIEGPGRKLRVFGIGSGEASRANRGLLRIARKAVD